jgi:hypothetical protein
MKFDFQFAIGQLTLWCEIPFSFVTPFVSNHHRTAP